MPNKDAASTRYSQLDEINAGNVKNLKASWTFSTGVLRGHEGGPLVVGNTMAQAVRERTSELAVLKTLGFSDTAVLSLVLAESLFVALVGGGLGLFAAWLIVLGGDPTGGFLPAFTLPNRDIVTGVALMVLVGIIAGILPAAGAMRLKITDALRKA